MIKIIISYRAEYGNIYGENCEIYLFRLLNFTSFSEKEI